jgi:hypothetical protein
VRCQPFHPTDLIVSEERRQVPIRIRYAARTAAV